VVADLDEAAEVDLVADVTATSLVGRGPQLLEPCRVVLAEPGEDGVAMEVPQL